MKNSIIHLLLIFALAGRGYGQQLQLNLHHAGSCRFNNALVVYGLRFQKPVLWTCIYRMDAQLRVKDSIVLQLPKTNPDSYLQMWSDTLHNYLNIYLQEKEKKLVTIYRFTRSFEYVATVEGADVARLNNSSMFSSAALYSQNMVYDLRILQDTSGKQFYLNKYILRTNQKNFDYEFKWQFPFEKKHIRSAHIFYADKKSVLLFVHISSGNRSGQWILTVNAETGKLVRGTRIGDRLETNTYLFGAFLFDNTSRSIQLIGEKFTPQQLGETSRLPSINNRTFATLYSTTIDSTGEVTDRQEFKVPIAPVVSGVKKTNTAYFLRIANAKKNSLGEIAVEADVFGLSATTGCYAYANTQVLRIVPGQEKPVLEKISITNNPLIEKFYSTSDKLDLNGKLCADSSSLFENLLHKPLAFPIKEAFKTDERKSAHWLLSKSNLKKGTISYAQLKPGKISYELLPADEVLKDANPQLIPLSDNSFVIGSQPGAGKYQLRLFAW